jgi:hypothetical protein
MKDEITIFLSPIDAERYKQFLQYYDIFTLLVDKKVFEQKSAAITINFDNQGHIGTITRNDVLFLSKIQFDNTNPK